MKSLFLLLLALPFSLAHAAGLDVRGEMSFFAELYPKNSIVTMLVVKGKMRSHLTGLMGEPVLNHQIRLDPYVSVFVRLPDGRIRSMAELPPEIERAAQKTRFTLVGSLILGSTSPQYHMKTFIPFDSGASVTPAEGTSFNVPGSPSWGRLVRTEVCGDAFLDDKTARQIAAGFEKKEVWLASADMCSDKVVIDDTALREAIDKACNAKSQGDNLPAWCPKKPTKEGKPERAKKEDKTGKDAGTGKPGKTDEGPGSLSALDELDKQELARKAPSPPPPPPPVKQPDPKPAPAEPVQVAAAEPTARGGKVIFAEDFKVPKGWQGRYETIESPGCAYLGANHAGIHMAFSPGGPVWREVSGFTPGQSYEITFEVRTLDPADAGKATFQIDDKVLHTIAKNGKVSLTFKASQPTHRVKFDWKVQSIKMAPVHVTNLQIAEEGGLKEVIAPDLKLYAGRWGFKLERGLNPGYFVIAYLNGKLQLTDYPRPSPRSWEVIQQPEIKGKNLVFTLRGIHPTSVQERIQERRFEIYNVDSLVSSSSPNHKGWGRVADAVADHYPSTSVADFWKEP